MILNMQWHRTVTQAILFEDRINIVQPLADAWTYKDFHTGTNARYKVHRFMWPGKQITTTVKNS